MMIVQSVNQDWEQSLLALVEEDREIHTQAYVSKIHSSESLKLHNAYALCEAMTAQYSRSFHMASALLPRAKRQAVRALYAFCRLADNLVDGGHEQPGLALDKLRERIHHSKPMMDEKDPSTEILLAWEDARIRHHVPIRFADQLLDGVERDLYRARYATFEELAVYCYGVASTVGLMSMHIIGFKPEATPYAVKMGVALQLTNILRDVGEDWREGRLYLPQDELFAFGLNEQDVAAQRVDERWRALMRFQIARNRRLYAEAWPGIASLNPSGRLAVAAAATLYQGILDDIEAHDYDVFSRRAHVSDWNKIKLLLRMYTKEFKFLRGNTL
jgi:phytoene synthase